MPDVNGSTHEDGLRRELAECRVKLQAAEAENKELAGRIAELEAGLRQIAIMSIPSQIEIVVYIANRLLDGRGK